MALDDKGPAEIHTASVQTQHVVSKR